MVEYYDFRAFQDIVSEQLPKPDQGKHIKLIDGHECLVKLPDIAARFTESMSMKNTAFAEYIGSNVFRILGFKAQATILGMDIDKNGKLQDAVGCISFLRPGERLLSLRDLKKERRLGNLRDNRLESIMETLDDIDFMSPLSAKKQFARILIVDAFIQNYDRNAKNWGFLIKNDGSTVLAPIYDCGSSLCGAISEDSKRTFMAKPESLRALHEMTEGTSALFDENHERIPHKEVLLISNPYIRQAMLDVVPIIKARKSLIEAMIDGIPFERTVRCGKSGLDIKEAAELERGFYKMMLNKTMEHVLEPVARHLGISGDIEYMAEEVEKADDQKRIQAKRKAENDRSRTESLGQDKPRPVGKDTRKEMNRVISNTSNRGHGGRNDD